MRQNPLPKLLTPLKNFSTWIDVGALNVYRYTKGFSLSFYETLQMSWEAGILSECHISLDLASLEELIETQLYSVSLDYSSSTD